MKLLAIFILLIVIGVAIYIYNNGDNGNIFKSVTCVPILENPEFKVLSYDENNKCPKDKINPFELTPQQSKDCLYVVYKDKNGNDVLVSQDCIHKAASQDSAEKMKKESKKCGLVFCDE